MPPYKDNSVILEDVELLPGAFRNFSGRPDRFNPAGGKRVINVLLDPELAQKLERDGWNVKQMRPREGGDPEDIPPYFLKVNISFPRPDSRAKPPVLVLITSGGRRVYDEETIEAFDQVEIESVDIRIRPWDWTINGNTGRSAYLNAIYVKVFEDDLAKKWAHLRELSASPERLALEAGDNAIDGEIVDEYDEEIDMGYKELTR